MINKDDYSPILYHGAKQRTPSPSSVAFYDMPGEVLAASIFFVPVLAREEIYVDESNLLIIAAA